MTDTLEGHEGTVSTGGRTITNLCFADDIDGLAGEEEQLAKLVERLDKASTAHGMEISAEKTKLMANTTSGMKTEIKIITIIIQTLTLCIVSNETALSFRFYPARSADLTLIMYFKPVKNEHLFQFSYYPVV